MSEQVRTKIRDTILAALPGATVNVSGEAGHYAIEVVTPEFEGMARVARDRLVLQSIAKLMIGVNAPVHAVDTLVTRAS
jgi:acid stress-induced BolA-like protein IbaG/YrbA